MRTVYNDKSSPRTMTRPGSGHASPIHTMPHYIRSLPFIRLCLPFVWATAHMYTKIISSTRVRVNFHYSKRPLVKLKTTVNKYLSLRTSKLHCDLKSLVNALVQLFVVAKCLIFKVGKWICGRRASGAKKSRMLLLLYMGGFNRYSEGRPDNDLHIGGIFPMEGEGGWQGGQACMPAAELALADVNARSDLLSGFKLLLHSNDSKVSKNKLKVTYLVYA